MPKCCSGPRLLPWDLAEDLRVLRIPIFVRTAGLKSLDDQNIRSDEISQSVVRDFAVIFGFSASHQPQCCLHNGQSDDDTAAGRRQQRLLRHLLLSSAGLSAFLVRSLHTQDFLLFLSLQTQLVSLVKRRARLSLPLHTHVLFV